MFFLSIINRLYDTAVIYVHRQFRIGTHSVGVSKGTIRGCAIYHGHFDSSSPGITNNAAQEMHRVAGLQLLDLVIKFHVVSSRCRYSRTKLVIPLIHIDIELAKWNPFPLGM